jgi:hypothetical protein
MLHIPRCGEPHGQGPGSIEARDPAVPPTANAESSFSTSELSHFLQATWVADEGTIFSNVAPQSLHLNSNSGIGASCRKYSQTAASLQSYCATLAVFCGGMFTAGAFFLAFFDINFRKIT